MAIVEVFLKKAQTLFWLTMFW